MGKRMVILGAAESGVGAAVLAQKKGFDVFVSDMGKIKPHYVDMLDRYGIAWEDGGHTEELVLNADEVIKSPGIPEDAPMVLKVKAAGIPIISEIEFAGRYTHAKMICITGSNGKTTTTQMLASILLARWGAERMCATEGNFNNEVGVPKMLLKLAFEHRGAVIECGMNHRGEMARLADWTRPTVALLTNAQREHQEFLRGVEETARENGLVIAALPESGTAVYPADDACADIWADLALARGVDELTYSTDPDVEADVMGRVENGELVISTDEGDVVRTKLRITGSHNVHNATGAAAAAFAMGIGPEAVAAGLGAFEPVPGRGTRFVGKHLVVIDEAYNANPDSVRAAMNVLAGEAGPRTFILGDMGEIGDSAEEAHREAGEYARSLGIDALYACGPLSRHAAEAFGEGGRWFETRDALIEALKGLRGTATVKASHFMGFAAVVRALQDNEE